MYCTNCGSRTPPKARFCPDCGEALRGGSHSAVRLPESGAEAERRIVTVMFCDIVGSTALTASMDPEAFATVREALLKTGASIRSAALVGSHATRYRVSAGR